MEGKPKTVKNVPSGTSGAVPVRNEKGNIK
jgi:hypothetical protein